MTAKLVMLIESEDRRGRGVDGDPIRLVRQLWTLDGQLAMERDDHARDLWPEAMRVLEDLRVHVIGPAGFNGLELARKHFRESQNGDIQARAANAETAMLAVLRFLERADPPSD